MSDAPDSVSDVDVDVIAETAARVREYLEPFEDVALGEDGACSLSWGSAKVSVLVDVFDEDQSIVRVQADCVTGAKVSPELYEYVATTEPDVGHFKIISQGDGTAVIALSHGLLGEFLNPAELRLTVVAVAYAADHFDDDLAARFGGTVHDAEANHSA